MKLRALFSPVVAFLRSAIDQLGKLDGKPGLSPEDVAHALQWIVLAQKTWRNGGQKHESVTNLIIGTGKVPPWTAPIITWALYQIASRTKLL